MQTSYSATPETLHDFLAFPWQHPMLTSNSEPHGQRAARQGTPASSRSSLQDATPAWSQRGVRQARAQQAATCRMSRPSTTSGWSCRSVPAGNSSTSGSSSSTRTACQPQVATHAVTRTVRLSNASPTPVTCRACNWALRRKPARPRYPAQPVGTSKRMLPTVLSARWNPICNGNYR